jgi:hypothetical protein
MEQLHQSFYCKKRVSNHSFTAPGVEMPSSSYYKIKNMLTLILLTWRNGELLIMPEDGRWDLTRRLKG